MDYLYCNRGVLLVDVVVFMFLKKSKTALGAGWDEEL